MASLGGLSVQSATVNPEYSVSIKKKSKNSRLDRDRHRHHNDKYSPFDDMRKERERDIEYQLDILDTKYKREKDRIDDSRMNKYDKKIRTKELKYQYEREKDRLKNEKRRTKKGSFYSN